MDRDNLPEDAVLVCAACGDTARHPEGFDDVSCAMNAVVCYEEKMGLHWIPYTDHPNSDATE